MKVLRLNEDFMFLIRKVDLKMKKTFKKEI